MRYWGTLLLLVLFAGSAAVAQETPTVEQMKKMYDDALAQLKTAQDRKNEMAAENEVLRAKVTELEQALQRAGERVTVLERESSAFADRSFLLRSHFAAWERFMRYYPRLKARWDAYLEGNIFALPPVPPVPEGSAGEIN